METTLQQIRERLTNQGLIFFLIMGLSSLAISLLGTINIGWHPIVLIEIILYLLALVTIVFRKRVIFIVRTVVLLGSFFLLGVVGLYAFGLASIAILMLVIVCLLTVVLLGTRPAIISLLIYLTTISIITNSYLTGSASTIFNANIFIVSVSAWILAFIGLAAVAKYIIIGVDITQTKWHQALQQSETQFRQLIEDSPFGIVIQSNDQIRYANPQTLHIVKADSAEAIVGRKVSSFVTANYLAQTQDRLHMLNVDRQKTPLVYRQITRLDGSVADITIQSRPITYQNQPSSYTIINDVTEKLKNDAALKESEARYRNIFQSTAVSIWEEDFSKVKAAVDAVKAEGVVNFRSYLDKHPEFVTQVVTLIKILDMMHFAKMAQPLPCNRLPL